MAENHGRAGSMKNILGILNKIAKDPSSKGKKDIIRTYSADKVFYDVVRYALDQDKAYGLTGVPEAQEGRADTTKIFHVLDKLAGKRGTTREEAEELAAVCGSDSAAREVVTRILRKDLRCGARGKLFNGVVKGWVYEVPYQRYKSFSQIHKIDFSRGTVVAQLKMDGLFSYLFTRKESDYFLSRNGSSFDLGPEFRNIIKNSWLPCVDDKIGQATVRMGELLVMGPEGKYLSRKEGNGIINSFISGKGTSDKIKDIHYVTWGFITEEEFKARSATRTYQEVLQVDSECAATHPQIKLSNTTSVNSLDAALDFYRDARLRAEEGAMVKVSDKLTWKDQQSGTPYGVKLKPEEEAELEIVEAYYGEAGKKWADHLGGLVVRTSCGGLITKVGSGFSDEDRLLGVDWWNSHRGKIVTCRFTGVTTDKSERKTMCFDHGRFVETRFHDKTEADTLQYCLELLKKGGSR
jgi:hypothetical protein